MPPILPENPALQQAIAAASMRLRAQIRQDLAALRQAVDASEQLIREVQREQAAVRKYVGTS